MTYDQAKIVVQRIEDSTRKRAQEITIAYQDSYMLGSILEQIKSMLVMSNLKFKDFTDEGKIKFPHEK